MNKHDCNASHVPEPIKWRCPICKEDADFIITKTDEMASEVCDYLHAADWCECDACGYEGCGKEISRLLTGKRTKCIHCNGAGWIVEE